MQLAEYQNDLEVNTLCIQRDEGKEENQLFHKESNIWMLGEWEI